MKSLIFFDSLSINTNGFLFQGESSFLSPHSKHRAGSSRQRMSIHVIIIGAGLAGLAAAISVKIANPEHKVTVLEAVQKLDEIGVCDHSSPIPSYFTLISFPRQDYN